MKLTILDIVGVLVCLTSPVEAQATLRIDQAFGGGEPDAPVSVRGSAGGGRFLLLESAASNLVPDDTNGVTDLFVYDALRGETERVSVGSGGEEGNQESRRGTISPDGRFVAFDSASRTLVPDDTNGDVDVFVRDRLLGTTLRVNLNNAGNEARLDSAWGSVSADGRHVAFDSLARNLTADDSNSQNDVFVRDRDPDGNGIFEGNGRVTRVTVPVGGTVTGGSFFPRISGNGRFVVFHSIASNLVPVDTNNAWDVFVHDRDPDGNGVFDEGNGVTELLSVGSTGVRGNRDSRDAAIDHEGRFAAFWSESNNLVPGDTNGQLDVYLRDLELGTTTRLSVGAGGIQGNGESRNVSLSADGRFVSFRSAADNLVPDDTNGQRDLFLYDRSDGDLRRVSLGAFDQEGDGDHTFPNLSADGRFLAFQSTSRNFRGSPVDGQGVYLRDLLRLEVRRGVARGSFGFTVSGAAGQAGARVWVLISCTPDKVGTAFGKFWLPLALDRCTQTLSVGGKLDAEGKAVLLPARRPVPPGLIPLTATALVLRRDATGRFSVTAPVPVQPAPDSSVRGAR